MNRKTARALRFRFFDKTKNNSGFNVTEILITMALIAILAAFSAPSFNKWLPNIRLKSAVRDLYANMQNAKIQAIKENKDWAVVFDTANNRYCICDDAGVDDDFGGIDDLTCSGDNNIVQIVSFSDDYEGDIRYGKGGSGQQVGGAAWGVDYVSYTVPEVDIAIFNPQGSGSGGYVHLEHSPMGQGPAFAVGTTTSGRLRIARWQNGNWE